MRHRAAIRRITLRNYKSIASASIDLGRLTFLVGPNGSGKSNVLDGLRFVAESLRTSIDHALRERSGIKEVRRRSGGHPNSFAIRLDFDFESGMQGFYAFQVGAKESGGFEVQDEVCKIAGGLGRLGDHHFHVKRGVVGEHSMSVAPPAASDRLYLVSAGGLPEFRPVYDALSSMEVYNLNPESIRNLQKPDAGELLRREGGNAASVFEKLPLAARDKINSYLKRIVPGVSEAETKLLGSLETLEFRQLIKGQKHSWRFLASSMSDGTLRAFGVLLALFQPLTRNEVSLPLVGLEEPETALHPGAAGILLAALREASRAAQIIVTSHSPDLLDDEDIPTESILAVENREGTTYVGSIDSAGRTLLKQKLFTPGELLRLNQLAPEELDSETVEQLKLFE